MANRISTGSILGVAIGVVIGISQCSQLEIMTQALAQGYTNVVNRTSVANTSINTSSNNHAKTAEQIHDEQVYVIEHREYFYYDKKRNEVRYFDYMPPVLFAKVLQGDAKVAKSFNDYMLVMQSGGFRYNPQTREWTRSGEMLPGFLEKNAGSFIEAAKVYYKVKESLNIEQIDEAAQKLGQD